MVIIVLLGLLLAPALFTGCGDSSKKAQAPSSPAAPKSMQQPISQSTATIAEAQPESVYNYRPTGRRDPFAPLISFEEKKAKAGDRPPLERFNVSEFKLTGIVWGGFGYNAMLEGPDGKGYFVHVGTIIGPNRGVVKKITSNTMVVEEKFKSSTGETDRKQIVVDLRKIQEGMQ